MTGKYSAMDIVSTAIQLEKDGHAYYTEAAKNTQSELGRKMFDRLAQDEVHHLEVFQKAFDSMEQTGDWRGVDVDFGEFKAPVFPDNFEPGEGVKAVPNDVEALKEAIELERKAIDFFNDALASTDDSNAKEVLGYILKQEELHLALLTAEHGYTTKSGFWFDFREFEMDGMY